MGAIVRSLIISIITSIIGTTVIFGVAAFLSLAASGMMDDLSTAIDFYHSSYFGVYLGITIVVAIILGLIWCEIQFKNKRTLKGYWKRRIEKGKPGIKFGVISLTIIPNILFSVLSILILAKYSSFLINLSTLISKQKSGLVMALLVCHISAASVFQLLFALYYFLMLKDAKCKNCKKVFCLQYERGEDRVETTEKTKQEAFSDPYYYVSDDDPFHRVRKDNHYSVREVKYTENKIYANYKCTCLYCGYKYHKEEYDKTT